MKSKSVVAVIIAALFLLSYKGQKGNDLIIGRGQMPNIAKDNQNNLHIVYGTGDSIMYSFSTNAGRTFSSPGLVAVLPALAASSMRGPQIASSAGSIIIIACNRYGNIYSYRKRESGKWSGGVKINDTDSVAKEQFMALGADGPNVFAVWLDLRNGRNEIFGARSADGGKTWSKNIRIYTSPDKTVCECCKPSVAVKGNKVFVMFRNWLKGNRDMYLIQSGDGGSTFGEAKKLGNDSWALNGCPMDGGGLMINDKGIPETVWRRKTQIFASEPGQPETAIGEGRSCTIESVNGKNCYAWTESGDVICILPGNQKKNLGKGMLPVIKAINSRNMICVWENDKQVHAAIVSL